MWVKLWFLWFQIFHFTSELCVLSDLNVSIEVILKWKSSMSFFRVVSLEASCCLCKYSLFKLKYRSFPIFGFKYFSARKLFIKKIHYLFCCKFCRVPTTSKTRSILHFVLLFIGEFPQSISNLKWHISYKSGHNFICQLSAENTQQRQPDEDDDLPQCFQLSVLLTIRKIWSRGLISRFF